MAEETAVLSFVSEEERDRALLDLPTEPSGGIIDVDAWQAEIEARKQEILQASIKAVESETEEQPTAPTETPAVPAEPQASAEEEEYVDFGRIKRSELPETLQKYKNAGDILKQAGHARKYADSLETWRNDTQKILPELQQKAKQAEDWEKKAKELEAQIKSTKPPESHPAPIPKASSSPSAIAEKLAALQGMSDDELLADPEKFGKFRVTVGDVVGELGTAYENLGKISTDFEAYRTETQSALKSLATKVDKREQVDEEQRKRAALKEMQKNALAQITDLQSKRSELATSKPLLSENGPCVERDVQRFADRIAQMKFGRPAQTWAERNSLVGAYLRGDPEMRAFCDNSGISPEDVDSSEQDMRNYAILVNVDNHMKGQMVDEFTGEIKQLRNPVNQQPVNFPDSLAAYKYILDSKGITQQEIEKRILEAEKKGQDTVTRLAQQQANAPKTVGNDGGVDPNMTGEGLTTEEALKIVSRLTGVGGDEVAIRAMRGDYGMFDDLNRAYKALNWPLMQPDEDWPKRG